MSLIRFSKKSAKRTACILTAGMMIFSAGAMTGCGKSGGGSSNAIVNQQEAMKTLAYKVNDISLEDSQNLAYNGFAIKNGKIYAVNDKYVSEGESFSMTTSIRIYNEDGTIANQFEVLNINSDNSYGGIRDALNIDDNGNISFMLYNATYDPVTYEGEEKYYIVSYDESGNKISEIDLGELVSSEDNQNGMYIQGYVADSQGNLYFNLGTCVRVCDSTGKKLFDTQSVNSNDNTWMSGLFLTNTGMPAVVVSQYSENKTTTVIREIDINSKSFGKDYDISGVTYSSFYNGGGDYLGYTATETGISGLRADTLTLDPVINLLNLGIDNSNISTFIICEDGSFVTVGYDYTSASSNQILNRIVPVDASEVKEKKVISLGCFYLDWNVRSQIAEFNKTNEDYIIYATSFSENNDTSDWETALTKFNNELLAGNVPDILLINGNMPVNSYISKGLFTDLYELIEKDPDLNKDAFLPNILRAFETNGKLYEITPSFSVQTMAAKTSRVGTERSLTISKAQEYLSQMPEGAKLFQNEMTAADFLELGIEFSDFVDYEKGTCNFDTPEFKKYLEIAKTYPAEIDYEAMYNDNPSYWEEQEFACRNDKALLYSMYLNDFSSYNTTRDAYIGEDLTFVGYPVSDESISGSAIYATNEFAISSKSAFKDGAWSFVKSVIEKAVTEEPEYQWNSKTGENVDTGKTRYVSSYYSLPVLKDQLDKLASQAIVPKSYINEDGQEVVDEIIYYINDQEIKVQPLTQADVDMLKDYFSSVDRVLRYDNNINNIVNEESKLFFSGTKTADETAAIIQSRASIYMSEQY